MAAHDHPIIPGPNNSPGDPNADLHLERLLAAGEEPFYRTFWKDLKEFVHPAKLPPLELTSTPVPVKEIWGFYGGQEKRAGLSSMLIHVAVLGLLFLIGTNKAVQQAVKDQINIIAPDLSPYKPTVKKRCHGWRRWWRRSFRDASQQREAASVGGQAIRSSHGRGS